MTMSSSEDDASIAEEKWDDMAIVRAFEDALNGRQNRSPSRVKKPSKSSRPKRNGRKASVASVTDAYSTQETSHQAPAYGAAVPDATQYQSQEDLYQAAYAQAYAHLQSQMQGAGAYAYQTPMTHHTAPPSYQAHAPPQFQPFSHPQQPYYHGAPTPGAPWTPGMQPPSQWAAPPFPSVPGQGSQDDLANLLLAWYQSGYYTGRYQAMQEMRARSHR
ncbi:hypothetical protein Poli38472_013532 [Pythium oligandrum]|uniref:Survival motor neuron Tudor domain-containing protein n=1 Tax=Pythium oligandrum TaxID=41045 RepID=A0A8K1C8B3_PYTOL|nr:hypothetical protein Poli38472_013532 [Pythium oligandrum]|eukprot:TMW58058.1 hypothetical protein Poli38472_013532 [Pythium oligandrum]